MVAYPLWILSAILVLAAGLVVICTGLFIVIALLSIGNGDPKRSKDGFPDSDWQVGPDGKYRLYPKGYRPPNSF